MWRRSTTKAHNHVSTCRHCLLDSIWTVSLHRNQVIKRAEIFIEFFHYIWSRKTSSSQMNIDYEAISNPRVLHDMIRNLLSRNYEISSYYDDTSRELARSNKLISDLTL